MSFLSPTSSSLKYSNSYLPLYTEDLYTRDAKDAKEAPFEGDEITVERSILDAILDYIVFFCKCTICLSILSFMIVEFAPFDNNYNKHLGRFNNSNYPTSIYEVYEACGNRLLTCALADDITTQRDRIQQCVYLDGAFTFVDVDFCRGGYRCVDEGDAGVSCVPADQVECD